MKHGSGRRISSNLVALSSAAVLSVYAAGYIRTRAAADRLENAGHREAANPPALRAPAPAAPPDVAEAIQPPAIAAAVPAAPDPKPGTLELRLTESVRGARVETPAAEPAAATAPVPATVPAVETATPTAPVTTTVPVTVPQTNPVPPDPEPAAPAPKPSEYKDGVYYGWGTSRHGSIQASVTIEGGKIVASSIAQCLTRYSCSWIAHLVPQVVTRQSANVDYVSGATQSTYAFYDAVVEALSKAR